MPFSTDQVDQKYQVEPVIFLPLIVTCTESLVRGTA